MSVVAPLMAVAPAKINLFLKVTGRRDDGYHLIDSLFVFAGIGDRLYAEPAETLSLRISGPFAGDCVAGSDNLVLRAARALQLEPGLAEGQGAHLSLEKNLPVAAGLGGGSADAAAALKLLQRLWRSRVASARLHQLALALGADVPACLAGQSQRVTGIGETIADVGNLPTLYMLLVNPGIGLSTAAVFGELARQGRAYSSPVTAKIDGLDGAGLLRVLQGLANDLEPAAIALAPEIAGVLKILGDLPGCQLARMSGSGASCFGLFPGNAALAGAVARISAAQPDWWVWGGAVAGNAGQGNL